MISEPSDLALARSLSLLTPPIFSHPLWSELFNNPAKTAQLSERLPDFASSFLRNGDYTSACQLYLGSAALKKNCGDLAGAIESVQLSKRIGEKQLLPATLIWSDWGLAALNAKQGDDQQARVSLSHLRERLIGSGEWVVGDIVEFVGLSLTNLPAEPAAPNLLLEWLIRWGEPPETVLAEQASRSEGKPEKSLRGYIHRFSGQTIKLRNLIYFWLTRLMFGENFARPSFSLGLQNHTPDPCSGDETGNSELPRVASRPKTANVGYGSHAFDEIGRTSLLPVGPGLLDPASESNGSNGFPDTDVVVHFLGKFRVFVNNAPIEKWPSRKATAVFKYLVTHRSTPVQREILMDTLWPDAEPDSARNRLNVALHSLRKTFQPLISMPVILFTRDAYLLNPEIEFWIDYEKFEHHLQNSQKFDLAAQAEAAILEDERAISLYQGDFLEEDRYEEWTITPRESLRLAYLNCLDQLSQIYFFQGHYMATSALCQRILAYDDCSENAYRLLMRCYARQGQPFLAMRLYLTCLGKLRTELDTSPSPETQDLYERIRRHDAV